MADFEQIPADIQEFFTTGQLPESLASQQATAPTSTVQTAAAPAEVEAPKPSPASPSSVEPPPAPQLPDLSVYERLLEAQQAREAELRQQLETVKGQMAKLMAVPAPDPTTDPLGYLNHQMKTIQDQINAMQNQTQQQTQTQEQQAQVQQFVGAVNSQINAFKATNPDYDAAYKHVIDARMQDYRDMGMTESQARQTLGQEESNIALRAMQQGKNPAEVVYKMAQRLGYKAQAAKPTDGATKLETIRKGQQASETVQASSRGEPTGEISIETLKNASEADLNKMVENDWEKIFGKSKGIFG